MNINIYAIFYVMGTVVMFIGVTMLFPLGVALIYAESDVFAFTVSSITTIAIGFLLWWGCRANHNLNMREDYIIVSFGWVLVSIISGVPFMIYGAIPSFTDAFFEMMSGYTTTGSTILTHVETLPHGLLFWRSMTHLTGGMGFIMVTIMLLPLTGIGGTQLFKVEADPGQGYTYEMIRPRVQSTALILWIIYLGLIFFQTFLLWLGGMSLFDALCHAFGTVSTSGYSTKDSSMGYYNNAYFDWVTIIFMFLGGSSFVFLYQILKGDLPSIKKNTEFRWYACIVLFFCIVITLILWKAHVYESFSESLRYASFQVVSLLTTTGFTTADYEQWPQAAKMFLFTVFFVGSCSGSTGSGIKIVHYELIVKNLIAFGKQIFQPFAVSSIRSNHQKMDSKIVQLAANYFILNIFMVLGGGCLMVLISDMDMWSSINSVIVTLFNIGPGFGEVGPAQNFAHISDSGKWFLSFNMLVGRLEMFSAIVLFYPSFWRD